MNKSCL